MTKPLKAIGIVRVSHVGGREGESFISPDDQRNKIGTLCEREGLELVTVAEELDTSGGRSLEKRPGLLQAVEAVEAGDAKAIVVAYASRLARSLSIKEQVVSRVEAAGGRVLSVDFGPLGEATASDWLSGTLIMAFAEYQRREAKERFETAQENAVRLGIYPFPEVPAGYVKKDRRLAPDPETAPVIAEAFAMRDAGKSVRQVHAYLNANGVERKLSSVAKILSNPLYIGRLEYGKFVNPESHEPIVDAALFNRVRGKIEPAGRNAKSAKLLARLGVLRCSSCGSRMTASNCRGGTYELYRCGRREECDAPVGIGANIIEPWIEKTTQWALSEFEGRKSNDAGVRAAEAALTRAKGTTEAFIEGCDGLDGAAIKAKITKLLEVEAKAQEAYDEIAEAETSITSVTTLGDWDDFDLDTKRGLIKAFFESITVLPANGIVGTERIRYKLKLIDPLPASRRTADALLPEAVSEVARVLNRAA
jgi:DNA invertase Pin-like site-specific DNA recombinase